MFAVEMSTISSLIQKISTLAPEIVALEAKGYTDGEVSHYNWVGGACDTKKAFTNLFSRYKEICVVLYSEIIYLLYMYYLLKKCIAVVCYNAYDIICKIQCRHQ